MQFYQQDIEQHMTDFVHEMIHFYDTMPSKPVFQPALQENISQIKKQSISSDGRPFSEVYQEMLQTIYANTVLAQHPRYFSCIPSTATPLSWAGDVLTNAYNPHHSCQSNAPAAYLIEKKLIRWMCDLAGYPSESGGLFVSGGSIANLTALTAARDSKLTYEERSRAVIYVSDQTHASVSKGLRIIGFRPDQIRIIPTDEAFRMDICQCTQAIVDDLSQQKKPFTIVASVGTTNTGSIDPLPEIAALCRKYDLWMHVDGAFGASALLSPTQKRKLSGIECSDSISWDAHKWMLQTYGCSMVLVRNEAALVHGFAAHPEYLRDAQSEENSIEFWDLGPELTRPARCLKLWLTVQTLGTDVLGQVIDHGCELAQLAENTIRHLPDWEIISPAQLGIVNFRYAPVSVSISNLDALNNQISQIMTSSGYAEIFTTELHNKKVLRMCTINPQTTRQDILCTIEKLSAIAQSLLCTYKKA